MLKNRKIIKSYNKIKKKQNKIQKLTDKLNVALEKGKEKKVEKLNNKIDKLKEEIKKMAKLAIKDGKLVKVDEQGKVVQQPQAQQTPSPFDNVPQQHINPFNEAQKQQAMELVRQEAIRQQQLQQQAQVPPMEVVPEQAYVLPQQQEVQMKIYMVEGIPLEFNVNINDFEAILQQIIEAINNQEVVRLGRKVISGRQIIFIDY